MRNFATWLLANGLYHRRLHAADRVREAWNLYVHWATGGDKAAIQALSKLAESLLRDCTDDNTISTVHQLDLVSLSFASSHRDVKPKHPIDQLTRNKLRKPTPGTFQLRSFNPYAFNRRSPKRAFNLVFDVCHAIADPDDMKKVIALTGKAQYASPTLILPQKVGDCFSLCNMILSHRMRSIVTRAPVFGKLALAPSKQAPIYVVSSNRSKWLTVNFKPKTFYGRLIGSRPIIFVVDADEGESYLDILKVSGQGVAQNVHVLTCGGGFGMGWNRHCALLHAKLLHFEKIWMFDDNVEEIKQGGKPIVDLDDRWIGDELVMPLYPGIMQQALGFNIPRLGSLNFCPLFAYSKEDLSMSLLLEQLLDWAAYMNPPTSVIKLDKTQIKPDVPGTLPKRINPMGIVAALGMWRDKDQRPLDLSAKNLGSYHIMKFQEQVLYDCLLSLREEPRALHAILNTWFVDLTEWQDFW